MNKITDLKYYDIKRINYILISERRNNKEWCTVMEVKLMPCE